MADPCLAAAGATSDVKLFVKTSAGGRVSLFSRSRVGLILSASASSPKEERRDLDPIWIGPRMTTATTL